MTFLNPKITVITVTYNASLTLLPTIESVFSQNYPNIEYIIIDGKSTDGTVELIKKFQHKLACWVSEKDNGIYDAMNKGIKASTGDWIIFIGADDVFYTSDSIQEVFTNNNDLDAVDFLYGDVILKSRKKIYGGSRTYHQLLERNINHQSIFYRKHIFKKLGLFNLKYKILADYAFNFIIFRDSSLVKKYVPAVITLYNDKGRSNQIIDGHFYEDQLEYFINVEKLSPRDYRLQTYFFFYGFALLLKNEKSEGLKNIFHSLTTGKRKFYYVLVGTKYLLSLAGFFRKIRTSFVTKSGASETVNIP